MPKRENLDRSLMKNNSLCDYCVHSIEDIPDPEQRDPNRLWCVLIQEIVSPQDRPHKENPRCDYEF